MGCSSIGASKWSMLVRVATLLLSAASFATAEDYYDTYSSGVFSAYVGDTTTMGISGDIHIFATKQAVARRSLGVSGAVFGLPNNNSSDGAYVVIHDSDDCDNRGEPLSYGRGRTMTHQLTDLLDGIAYVEATTDEFDYETDFFWGHVVAVYLGDDTLAGCGQLFGAEDEYVLETVVNSFPGLDDFQTEVTMVVYPETSVACYFATAGGLEPNVERMNICGSRGDPETTCGIQIRSQTTCEEDLMAPTVYNREVEVGIDPWTWSRYYSSSPGGLAQFTQCIHHGWSDFDTIDMFAGQSMIIYDTDGVGLGCGMMQQYEPPSSELVRSNVFFTHLNTYNNDTYPDVYGAIFIFHDEMTTRKGLVGVAGLVGNLEADCGSTGEECEAVIFDEYSDCAGSLLVGELLATPLTIDEEGSFFGAFEVSKADLKFYDYVVGIRLPGGEIATCDYLYEVTDGEVYTAKTVPYPGRVGSSEIISSDFWGELCSFGVAYGLEPNIQDCGDACLYQVTRGTSCDKPNDDLYDRDYHVSTPWNNVRYESTDQFGVAIFGGCVDTGLEEYNYTGHSVVLGGPDNLPSSCGLLTQFRPASDEQDTCNPCPLDGYEISRPEATVSFGGVRESDCSSLVQIASPYLYSSNQCIEIQQAASRSCGCAPAGTKATTSSKAVSMTSIIFGVIAGLVALLLVGAVCWKTRFGKSRSMEKTLDDLALEQEQNAGNVQNVTEQLETHAEPVAMVVEEPSSPRQSHNTRLTSKNQLQGESFWEDRDVSETPYAQVVSIENAADTSTPTKSISARREDSREEIDEI